MKMKKLLALLLALTMVFALFACGDPPAEDDDDDDEKSSNSADKNDSKDDDNENNDTNGNNKNNNSEGQSGNRPSLKPNTPSASQPSEEKPTQATGPSTEEPDVPLEPGYDESLVVGDWYAPCTFSAAEFFELDLDGDLEFYLVMEVDSDGTFTQYCDEDSVIAALDEYYEELVWMVYEQTGIDDPEGYVEDFLYEILDVLTEGDSGDWELDGSTLTIEGDEYEVEFDGEDMILYGDDLEDVFGDDMVRFSPI